MSEELIYINGSYQRPNSVKKEVSKAVKELVGLAPEEFDTMQELAEAVQENTKAIQDNAEALQNVKIEAEAPLEFKDGEVKLNYDSGLQVIDKRLCLKKASFDHMGGVKIGTGYYGDKGGIECTDSGRIGLLPPSQSNLGGIKTPKLHTKTPPIKTTSDGSYYQIETDVYGNAFVRIPKTPESNVSVEIASLNTPGLIKLGTDDLDQHHFGLRTKKDGNAYVNLTDFVPYSVSSADSTKYGGIKLGYSENESNYAVKLDSEGHAYVDLSNFSAPESSGSVDTATIDKAGIVKLGTGTIHGETVPVSTDMYGGLAFAIASNLYNDSGVLNIKIADNLTPGVIKLGTGDTITSGNGSNYGLQYSDYRGAYVTVPTINADVATSTKPGIIKLFTDDYANASNANFIGIGANSNGQLVFKIGTGLQELSNGAVSLKLDERYFTHNNNNQFTLKIDNIKTDLGL